jgi:rhodanese-related sulfurtransferase
MTVTTITPLSLAELYQEGRRIDLLDVRTPAEYQEMHAAGARNVPLEQLDPVALLRSRTGSPEVPLYVICRSGSRGPQACAKFLAAGFPNVVNVEGGTLAWAASNLPVVRGKKTISLPRQVQITAGLLALLGAVLAWLVHPAFVALSGVVGAGFLFSGITDTCPLGLMLARMPWNQVKVASAPCCATSEVCS